MITWLHHLRADCLKTGISCGPTLHSLIWVWDYLLVYFTTGVGEASHPAMSLLIGDMNKRQWCCGVCLQLISAIQQKLLVITRHTRQQQRQEGLVHHQLWYGWWTNAIQSSKYEARQQRNSLHVKERHNRHRAGMLCKVYNNSWTQCWCQQEKAVLFIRAQWPKRGAYIFAM